MSGSNLKLAPQRRAALTTAPARRPPTAWSITRRRWMVGSAKRLLPVVALALLTAVALWPEISGEQDRTRLTYRRAVVMPESGALTDANYHGVDDQGHPYTMTAAVARQANPDRIDLTSPKADLTLEGSTWVMVQANTGVYIPRAGQLDLSGDVTLYRDDGTTLRTDAATLDTKAGVASTAERVHVEGPFGTLDAQGMTVLDRAAVIQFPGPGRLVLNGGAK